MHARPAKSGKVPWIALEVTFCCGLCWTVGAKASRRCNFCLKLQPLKMHHKSWVYDRPPALLTAYDFTCVCQHLQRSNNRRSELDRRGWSAARERFLNSEGACRRCGWRVAVAAQRDAILSFLDSLLSCGIFLICFHFLISSGVPTRSQWASGCQSQCGNTGLYRSPAVTL